MIERIKIFYQRSPSYLIAAAMALHLILTISIYVSGRLTIFHTINENGLMTAIAPDSLDYLPQAKALAETLSQNGFVAWLAAPFSLHIKLYSLAFAILGPLVGANILSAEPINILCYIAILFLTFKVGEEAFDRRVGLMAATALALWPSFLLHTTQLLKDPLFIAALLLLLLAITYWLTRILSLANGLKMGLAGGAAAYTISLTRSGVWGPMVLVIILIGTGLVLIRQVREKQFLAGNMLSVIAVLLAISLILISGRKDLETAPSGIESTPVESASVGMGPTNSEAPIKETRTAAPDYSGGLSLKGRADLAAVRITQMRREFVRLFNDSGSNIDSEVVFASALDVLRYLPRAMLIGFLAPFPNQWFSGGKQVGSAGRLMSGLEMLAIYAIELLALIGLWRSRSRLPAWLLFGVATMGVISLALAVINIGALYRMRYAFFILLLLLGMNGLSQIFSLLQKKRVCYQAKNLLEL